MVCFPLVGCDSRWRHCWIVWNGMTKVWQWLLPNMWTLEPSSCKDLQTEKHLPPPFNLAKQHFTAVHVHPCGQKGRHPKILLTSMTSFLIVIAILYVSLDLFTGSYDWANLLDLIKPNFVCLTDYISRQPWWAHLPHRVRYLLLSISIWLPQEPRGRGILSLIIFELYELNLMC